MTPGTPVCLSGRIIDRSPKASQHRHTTILDTKHTPSQAQTTDSLSMPQPIISTISPSTHPSIARPTPLPGTSSCFSINVFRPLAKPMSTASHHHSPQLLLLASVVCQRLPALPTTICVPFPLARNFAARPPAQRAADSRSISAWTVTSLAQGWMREGILFPMRPSSCSTHGVHFPGAMLPLSTDSFCLVVLEVELLQIGLR